MFAKSAAVLALSAALLPGCANISPRSKVALGAAMAVAGVVAFAASSGSEECPPESFSCPGLPGPFAGLAALEGATTFALLGGGLAELGSGLLDLHREDESTRADLAAHPVAHAAPAPAPSAIVGLDHSRVENRLAIQASVTARAGHCDAARAAASQLSQRDAALYAKLLASDGAVAGCLRTPPYRM